MVTEGFDIAAQESVARRACDQCRLRKIRCDKRSPCSNCQSSQIACRSTGAGQKPSEPRRRVLISSQYERKIDSIDKRLGNIEAVLHDLRATALSGLHTPPQPCSKPTTFIAPSPSKTLNQHEPVTPFEGSSSLTAHSAYASQFLKNAFSKSHVQITSPKLDAALSTLKHIVDLQGSDTSTKHSEWLPQPRVTSLRELPLPPVDLVMQVLRDIKDKSFSWMQSLAYIGIDRVIDKCHEVFFASEDFSDEDFVIANGGLYFIFAEYEFVDENHQMREIYRNCMNMTRRNLQAGLVNLRLLMPASADAISALSLGAMHAIEISKPSFALTLISAASHLCQALGYHRESPMSHGSESARLNKVTLFWTVYCIDKALSLRLGRAATMPDYDISVPMVITVSGITEPWNTIYNLWIHHARIQGRVYEMLYSPKALSQPEEQRASQALQLASELQWMVMEPHKKEIDRQSLSLYDSLSVKTDEVAHLTLLTMIYRAIPAQDGTPGGFTSECVETARAALEHHQQCMKMLNACNKRQAVISYLHWTILHSPFTPFIVLFCHTIQYSSYADLHRLGDFVASLQPNSAFSEAIAKLHRLCQLFCNIAQLYLEAKAQPRTQEDQVIGQEFDTYFSALGLAPLAVEDADALLPTTSATIAGVGPTYAMQREVSHVPVIPPSTLQKWFSGNQHMMGLLEDDLPLFSSSVW
ncbi:fungal-specific transcription factor domain protein [Aspergillus flavus]|uniref:Fungal-specific transcription factor domain protein n=1 Tax=Aspergillus flavus (strain ATCC 200026 / FGSC A1120 / IAM 13836 / NRRL 3357 / JCM 12722 / SRRC 167) TaxID=332952 RepID=A0A7U2MPB9_ASPFN|nr:hypothetical protein AFLA_003272 [Aspergillus flavus NRRL3357]QRD87512.1 fungal-specific transcription factor domain protein [Aspergillus flavus]RAQ60898.1 hypothetical protein COH21_008092 [Aspergillus flavus]RAQ76754.1 hypothetical protein COH20_010823 [Aspergillus flavus]